MDVLMLCGARRKVLYVQTGSMPWLTAVGQRDGAKTLALPVYEAISSRSAVVYYRDISGTGIIMPAAESTTDRKGCLLLDFDRQLIQLAHDCLRLFTVRSRRYTRRTGHPKRIRWDESVT